MVLEFVIEMLNTLSQVNTVLLAVVFLGFIVVAYKVFQTLIKAFIVGVISASFPVVASLMGLDVPLTLNSVIWFAMLGVCAFMLYASVSGGAKIARMVMKPFGVFFRKKPVKTVIIREREIEPSGT